MKQNSAPPIAQKIMLMTITDFLSEFHISRDRFYKEKNAKKIKITKYGKRTYIKREHAESWYLLFGEEQQEIPNGV